MKRFLGFLVASVTCLAGDMLRTTDADFKKPAAEDLKALEHARPKLDLSKEEDRKLLESMERMMYRDAMIEVAGPLGRATKISKGESSKELWAARRREVLNEFASSKPEQDSLQKAFAKLEPLLADRDTTILERVVRAKFGGEVAWIFVMRWERTAIIESQLNKSEAVSLGHVFFWAIRASDLEVVSQWQCD